MAFLEPLAVLAEGVGGAGAGAAEGAGAAGAGASGASKLPGALQSRQFDKKPSSSTPSAAGGSIKPSTLGDLQAGHNSV
jgi:hypothetical protein